MSLPHAILPCCYGGWRYGRHRVREKRTAEMQAHGAERSPKYSIKAVVSIQANCPAISSNRGRSAPKGQDQKGYERVVTGAVVAKIPYQEIRGSEGP